MIHESHKNTFVFVFTFILLIACPAGAQHIRHLGLEDGLNGRQAFNIVQDKEGFLWIATRFGVDRFNGESIKNYAMDILYNGSIPIRSIHVVLDRDSSLWAYTDRGTIYQYNELRDEFIAPFDFGKYLKTIHFDSENRLYAVTPRDIGRLQGDTLCVLKRAASREEDFVSLTDYDQTSLLLLTTKNIYRFNKESGEIIPILNREKEEVGRLTFETCFYDSLSQKIWVGSDGGRLLLYDLPSATLTGIDAPELQQHLIRSIAPLNDTYLLVGTEGVGACLLNTQTLSIEKTYNRRSSYKSRINDDVVYDVYRDRYGSMWLSCYSEGVSVLNFTGRGFQTISHEEGNPNSLSRNTVCAILEDSEGNFWFGTHHELCRWDRKKERWTRLFESKNIITLYEDSRGYIWVGTFSTGVYVIDKQGNILHNYIRHPDRENSINSGFIYTIAEDSKGDIWFGGRRGDTSKLNLETGVFTSIPVTLVNHIVQKDSLHMLISTELGVSQVSLDGKEVAPCAFSKNLKSKYVSDMYIESDSIVWLATYGDGLNRCCFDSGRITGFTRKDGLPSDIIHAFEPDDAGNLWFSSENGIGRFNLQTHEVMNFSKADGVLGERFRQMSKTKSRDGKLYFGSHNGVTYFDPREIHKEKSDGVLFLESFGLFNQVVKPGDKNSPLKDVLNHTEEIVLSYKQHSFFINFLAIDHSLGQNCRYMWKLDNMDQNWSAPTTERVANYTNLSPNSYYFRVRYLDESNRILDERMVKIVVTPPFWQTGWARFIFVWLFLLIAYLVYRYTKQRLLKKQSEEKIRFFINTAHDIRTPLTLINGPIYELKEQIGHSKKSDYLLGLVIDNLNKLNKMFSQLLDFQKAYESQDQLLVRKRDVNRYLEKKLLYWKSSAAKKEITFNLNLPDEKITEWFDIEKIDKILDNLVSNAIKYTPEQGHVEVKLTADASHWKITVVDDGIGISKQEQNNLFQRFYRSSNAVNSQVSGSGLGLLLVKKYVTLHKGSVGYSSAKNQGSEFYVQFRRGCSSYQNTILLDDNDIPILDEEVEQEVIDTGKLRIKLLIVEDNADLRRYLHLSFSPYYKVYTAENGAEAWRNIQRINPDIVISDFQMPEMDGFELCEKIKNTFETSHIPVVLLTVVSDKLHVVKGFNLGLDDYIEKPFDVKYLKLKIDNIIQNRKLLRHKFLGINKEEALIATQATDNALNAEFIRRATAIIEANLTNAQFSISDLSKEMGLSRTLLFTKFNSITGYTPNDFIKTIKMNKAIVYFKEKKHTINEVALLVGFEEPAYFSTCFKKVYGKSPKQFIEENIK